MFLLIKYAASDNKSIEREKGAMVKITHFSIAVRNVRFYFLMF